MIGRTPWRKIEEKADIYLRKSSRPGSTHPLMEPSHMNEEGVNDWLSHWLSRQKRGDHGLALKDPSGRKRVKPPHPSLNKGKQRYVEPDDDDDEEDEASNVSDGSATADNSAPPVRNGPDTAETSGTTSNEPGQGDTPGGSNSLAIPTAFAKMRKTRRQFLATLSDDGNYHQLLLLLDVAPV